MKLNTLKKINEQQKNKDIEIKNYFNKSKPSYSKSMSMTPFVVHLL